MRHTQLYSNSFQSQNQYINQNFTSLKISLVKNIKFQAFKIKTIGVFFLDFIKNNRSETDITRLLPKPRYIWFSWNDKVFFDVFMSEILYSHYSKHFLSFSLQFSTSTEVLNTGLVIPSKNNRPPAEISIHAEEVIPKTAAIVLQEMRISTINVDF